MRRPARMPCWPAQHSRARRGSRGQRATSRVASGGGGGRAGRGCARCRTTGRHRHGHSMEAARGVPCRNEGAASYCPGWRIDAEQCGRGHRLRFADGGGCVVRRRVGAGNQGLTHGARVHLCGARDGDGRMSATVQMTDRFGAFGGRYVPETLIPALDELEAAYAAAQADPTFRNELSSMLSTYVGRPSPVSEAPRFSELVGARVLLKREDLNHTGAHKINHTVLQVLLAQRMGKRRISAETGAGQHGVATATVCARYGLAWVVSMAEHDIRRQAPNVERMKLLGAEVAPVEAGARTLKEAVSAAIRDWVANVETTHYVIGSAVGPAPFPALVRDLQRVIGDEAREQALAAEGALPARVIACVGGGSNSIGIFTPFVADAGVDLIGVEAAGEGLDSGRHGAS